MDKFKTGDRLNYGFVRNVTIVGSNEKYYYLKDRDNDIKPIYKELVDKHGMRINHE